MNRYMMHQALAAVSPPITVSMAARQTTGQYFVTIVILPYGMGMNSAPGSMIMVSTAAQDPRYYTLWHSIRPWYNPLPVRAVPMGIANENQDLRRFLDASPPGWSMSDVLAAFGIPHMTAWTGYHLHGNTTMGLDWYFAWRETRLPIRVWQRWWLQDKMHERLPLYQHPV